MSKKDKDGMQPWMAAKHAPILGAAQGNWKNGRSRRLQGVDVWCVFWLKACDKAQFHGFPKKLFGGEVRCDCLCHFE